jgi:lantibiotic modifying enzyme
MSWAPLLDGPVAARARNVVRELAADLFDPRTTAAASAFDRADIAVFMAYHEEAFGGIDDYAVVRALEGAAEAFVDSFAGWSLYDGACGPAWAIEHLAGCVDGGEGELALRALDEAVLRHVERTRPRDRPYDLISGMVGMGVYALERLPRPAARRCLEVIVQQLDAMSVSHDDGITWLTPPRLLNRWQSQLGPDGYYDVGMAHGIAGVIALLARVHEAGIGTARVAGLLEGAISWLLAQRMPKCVGSRFPAVVPVGSADKRPPSRSAWCYGDPGIAVALLSAAQSLGRGSWAEQALSAARSAANGTEALILSTGLCHGAFGLGHLFNRLFRSTGDEVFAEAARAWFERGLAEPWRVRAGDACLLTGTAGIGLALLAAIDDTEPAWDRVMLLDLNCPA